MYWKYFNPNWNVKRYDKVELQTTCIKNVRFKIIKIRRGCQYVGYLYYSKNLSLAAQNLCQGRMQPAGWT